MERSLWVFYLRLPFSMDRTDVLNRIKVPFDPNSESDQEVVERVADLGVGIFSQPIYGVYPY